MVEKGTEVKQKLRYSRNTDLDPQLVWRGKDEWCFFRKELFIEVEE